MNDYEDPRWQQKRLRIMERDGWCCVSCGDTAATLAVHHKMYRGRAWDVPDDFLQTLCDACHSALGRHPKGGVWWSRRYAAGKMLPEAEPIPVVVVHHCPLCGSLQCDPCGCGWNAKFGIPCGTNWGTYGEWPASVVAERVMELSRQLKTQRLPASEEDQLLNQLVALRRSAQGIR